MKLLPLCLHSVGIPKIRLVKLKIRTDLQGICIKCSAHPLWVIANKIESFTMNDSVICFLSDMFMAAHAYLHIGTYLYTMCIMFNQYSKSFYISRDGLLPLLSAIHNINIWVGIFSNNWKIKKQNHGLLGKRGSSEWGAESDLNPKRCGVGVDSIHWSGDRLPFLTGSYYGHKISWLYP